MNKFYSTITRSDKATERVVVEGDKRFTIAVKFTKIWRCHGNGGNTLAITYVEDVKIPPPVSRRI